jgi:SAM-dependent methyltransferase
MNLAKQALTSAHEVAVLRRRVRVLASHISKAIPDSGSVLDVGCGDGKIAEAVMELRPDLNFRGIDVFLRPTVAIQTDVYDGTQIPFAGNSFDWVTVVDVLHHTDNPAYVLAECARVARKGIVIKDHLREGFLAAATLRFMDWVGNHGYGVRLPYNYLTATEWNSLFRALNVRPVSWVSDLGLYPAPFNLLFDRGIHFVAAASCP